MTENRTNERRTTKTQTNTQKKHKAKATRNQREKTSTSEGTRRKQTLNSQDSFRQGAAKKETITTKQKHTSRCEKGRNEEKDSAKKNQPPAACERTSYAFARKCGTQTHKEKEQATQSSKHTERKHGGERIKDKKKKEWRKARNRTLTLRRSAIKTVAQPQCTKPLQKHAKHGKRIFSENTTGCNKIKFFQKPSHRRGGKSLRKFKK
ncbi:hypothetical protein, conserved in T. vivax [Trypanosoma vivax Y486]|uniref:Uncharacterized protein n=1 Tax=Trypanosoma vivax (strain Y486) TaxID=1055687 RepID=F9WP43_TRYVY|nr:hypothetical protein, conserved in T. vivax [Trypanosoma vivax Y486]|eukprot:CCD19317.1 hypothetical protein, conserved in T. vivax [Trypanosoma vivax Y486]